METVLYDMFSQSEENRVQRGNADSSDLKVLGMTWWRRFIKDAEYVDDVLSQRGG
jgi:hypothetical protein